MSSSNVRTAVAEQFGRGDAVRYTSANHAGNLNSAIKPPKLVSPSHLGYGMTLLALLALVFPPIAGAQETSLGDAVDDTSLSWTTGGDANWFGQASVYHYDGDAAQSGDVDGGQTSWIQTTVTGPGVLSFYWKGTYVLDTLIFSLDGVNKAEYNFFHDWELQVFPVLSGSHTLKWVYLAYASGQKGYLDKVVYTPGSGPTLGDTVDNASLVWTTGGGAGWLGQTEISYYGGDAAKSGNAAQGESSWAETTVAGPGTLSFYWRVSTFFEMQHLTFSIDGVSTSSCRAYTIWEPQVYPIPAGNHTLRWEYTASKEGGAGYLDRVGFAPGSGPALGDALDNSSLVWTTDGDAKWFGQTEISYCDGAAVHSGDVAQGQSSWIETTVTGPGIMSFHWKMVAPFMTPDLACYVDGERKSGLAWSGLSPWVQQVHPISSGNHTLRWSFSPDGGAPGSAFLDKVGFIPGPAIMTLAPNGGETWDNRDFHAITWVSSEDVGPCIRIELDKSGDRLSTITAGTENDGYYTWFAPATVTPGADYQIRIVSGSNSPVYDSSDGNFAFTQSTLAPLAGALIVNGANDYAQAAPQSELDLGGGSFTLEAWINFQGFSGEQIASIIVKSGSYGLTGQQRQSGSQTLRCLGFDNGRGSLFTACSWPAYENGWHHVAAVYDQNVRQVRFYLDGMAFGDPINPGAILNSAGSLRTGDRLEGAVDEVRISDIARYPGNFQPLRVPFPCDGHTVALWHLDEIEGSTLFHDACGGDNVLVGFNGAHTEGVSGYSAYLPLVVR